MQFHTFQVVEFTQDYHFHKISSTVINLLTNDISALYYTAIKDRLYCDHVDCPTRRAAQYTLSRVFSVVARSIAPIVPHLVEEMFLYLPQKGEKTFFTSTQVTPNNDWEDFDMEKVMEVVLRVKRDVNKEVGAGTADKDVELIFSKRISALVKVRKSTIVFLRVT